MDDTTDKSLQALNSCTLLTIFDFFKLTHMFMKNKKRGKGSQYFYIFLYVLMQKKKKLIKQSRQICLNSTK